MPKKLRIVIEYEPGSRTQTMLNELKEEFGQKNNPPIMLQALSALHRKTFPGSYYTNKRPPRVAEDAEDEEERYEREEDDKIKRDEAKKRVQHQRLLDIAKLLNGEVMEKGPGNYVVKYYQYSDRSRNMASIPLSMMDEGLVRKQYWPDRETVEKLQAEGKVNYKLD